MLLHFPSSVYKFNFLKYYQCCIYLFFNCNTVLAVRVVEVSNVETEEFRSHSTRSGSDEDWGSNGGLSGGSVGSVGSGGGGGESWLRLEKRALVDNSEGSLVRLVYASFDRLEEILRPGNTSRVVNSKVIIIFN